MRLEYQILAAVALDLVLGDPRWLPHPIRFIGRLACGLESPMRRAVPHTRAAGIATAMLVILITGLATAALVFGAARLHPALGSVVSVLMLYTTFAARDLANHSAEVRKALKRGDLLYARHRVSWMVGRDTDCLDEPGVVRAAVESVAENIVDGFTAPLFFAVIGGPVGAMVYKAINTLDSTFGYKNERYIDFGWASAKIDDMANFLPARLTAPLVVLAALVIRLRPGNALRICLRDHSKHASPNSGITEAAVAGALSVRLGGLLYRKGKPVEMPTLGDSIVKLEPKHILRVNALMLTTSILSTGAFLGIRLAFIYFWRGLI
jgi:adenosylcobinamide-phosphate synthase